MYKIFVDSGSDLPLEYLEENDIGLITLIYSVEDVEYADDCKDAGAKKWLYEQMKLGKATKTSQPLQSDILHKFMDYAEKDIPVMYVTLSSGISGTYNSACLAKNRCLEQYPNAKIEVIDSLCACAGYGLLIRCAVEEKNNGMPFEALAEWIMNKRHQLVHWFTVDTLEYLHRGGRVSKTVAVVGGVLKLKPVMRVDETGHLVLFSIARSRKNAIKELVANIISGCESYEDKDYAQTICISHADCPEDAEICKKLLMENEKTQNVIISEIGPVIGCHSGPGTLAIYCFANSRMKDKD